MVLGYPIAGKLHVTQNAMDTGLCGIIHLFFSRNHVLFQGKLDWCRDRMHILLLSLCVPKSLTRLLSWFLTIWTIFWEIFKKISRKNQEFCEKCSQIFIFFQKMRRTFHAVFMQFICGLYAVSKLHINCMQFLCGLRQTAYSLAQTAYSLYAVWKPHTNRI